MTRTRSHRAGLPRCILDSGALSALCAGSHRAKAWLAWVKDLEGQVIIPTAVLVECTTGAGDRDAEVNRIIGILVREEASLIGTDETIARCAGKLRYEARLDDGIDALVAAVAVGDGSPAMVLTSDPLDLQRLLAREPQVSVRKV